MLLLITGPAQSGKSIAVERIIRTALQDVWSHVTIINGKTGQLIQSANSGGGKLRITPAASPEVVVQTLAAAGERSATRSAARAGKGPLPDRELVVIDDVHEFTRSTTIGTAARAALTRISARAVELGDLVVLVTQRASGAIPPAVRTNTTAELRMLGDGQFQLVAQGQSLRTGRVDPAAALANPDTLTVVDMPAALTGPEAPRAPTLVTRYEGGAGSGRTYALRLHQGAAPDMRRVELDVKAYSHKALIVACLEQCGAALPTNAHIGIPDLVASAAVALQARPTLLLLDNVDQATPRMVDTLQRLIDAATEAVITLTPPPGNLNRDYVAPLRRRAALVAIRPLDHTQAQALVHQVAPAIGEASAQAVVQRADGNPQAIVAFAERVAAHGAEERHRLEVARTPSRWLNLLLLFAVMVVVILIQRTVAHDVAGAVLSALVIVTMWFIRPRFRAIART